MTTLTEILRLRRPSPDGSDVADLAEIIGNLADDVDLAAAPAYTTAELIALPAAERPAGRVFYDTTTGEVKVSTGTGYRVLVDLAALEAGDASRLPLTGGTLTGPLTLPGAPTASAHAATKDYVDQRLPTGAIVAFGGSAAPTGWHLCDGSAHGSSALQTVLGTATTPDLRGRFILAAGQGSGLTNRTPGATGGKEAHALSQAEMPAHSHTTDVAPNHTHAIDGVGDHSHGLNGDTKAAVTGSGRRITGGTPPGFDSTWPAGAHTHSMQGAGAHGHTISSTGGGAAHENMPPFYALVYIIKK